MAKMLTYLSPVFAAGYVIGWMSIFEHSMEQSSYEMPLFSGIALHVSSTAALIAALVFGRDEDANFFSDAMTDICTTIMLLSYVMVMSPAVLLGIITGFNFPYIFCVFTWGAPFIAAFFAQYLD